jgi:hypothetical protein
MADYAAAQVTFHHVPPEDARAVFDFIEAWGLDIAWGTDPRPEGKVLIGEPYTDDEARLSIGDDLYSELSETGVYFECQQDPKYEYDGQIDYFAPELGRFTAFCNASGDLYLTESQLRGALGDLTAGDPHATLREFVDGRLADLTGQRWREAFARFVNDGITEVPVPPEEDQG